MLSSTHIVHLRDFKARYSQIILVLKYSSVCVLLPPAPGDPVGVVVSPHSAYRRLEGDTPSFLIRCRCLIEVKMVCHTHVEAISAVRT